MWNGEEGGKVEVEERRKSRKRGSAKNGERKWIGKREEVIGEWEI